MARRSRRLVELARDVPLEHPLEELTLQGIPEAPLKAFLEHHGFRSLLARLGAVADAPVAAPAADVVLPDEEPCDHDAYETVIDAATLDRWIAEARHQGFIAVDTETRSEEHTSELQSLMRNSYAVFCLKKKHTTTPTETTKDTPR